MSSVVMQECFKFCDEDVFIEKAKHHDTCHDASLTASFSDHESSQALGEPGELQFGLQRLVRSNSSPSSRVPSVLGGNKVENGCTAVPQWTQETSVDDWAPLEPKQMLPTAPEPTREELSGGGAANRLSPLRLFVDEDENESSDEFEE